MFPVSRESIRWTSESRHFVVRDLYILKEAIARDGAVHMHRLHGLVES